MKIIEPKFRCGGNWAELATLFNYKIDKHDQDWTYTIVEPERIEEYIQAYKTKIINDDTKFSLMEMIIQANCDQPDEASLEKYWKQVSSLLIEDFELHKYTIWYWCIWDTKNFEDLWEVAPNMRELWKNI